MKRQRWIGFVIALILAWGGCVATAVHPETAAAEGHPKVEWALLQAEASLDPGQVALTTAGVQLLDGRVLAVVEHEAGHAAIAGELRALGAIVRGTHAGLTQAWLPVSALADVAELPGVIYVRRPHRPVSLEVPEPQLVTEGVTLIGASLFHAKGVLGQGVKVAVIDAGFGGLAQAQRMGEIHPQAIAWTRDYTGRGLEEGGPHGTAVAQIVHNMAPGAALYLARIGDEIDLAQAVLDCALLGVDIIVHALGWFNTDFGDGTGVIADIARTAASQGILWINAAGNHAQKHWTGTPAQGPDGWLEFEPGVTELELVVDIPGWVEVALTWDEWPQAAADLDLYLFDADGNEVAVSQSRQRGEAPPAELVSYMAEPGRYTVRVHAYRARDPVEIKVFSLGHELDPHVPRSSILAPGTAEEVLAVGAIGLGSWHTGPQQPYSSQGPTHDGRLKPDLMGLDGVNSFAYLEFVGTSAAAPHVGGAAALLLAQARDNGTELSLEDLRDLLSRWALDMGEPGPDPVFGEGRLRVFVEQMWGRRAIHAPREGTVAPGESLSVEIVVRMAANHVGGVVLRERLPAGLVGVIERTGGADGVEEGSELIWRWEILSPGEERTVRYRITVPENHAPGAYAIAGHANHDPVDGDRALNVAAPSLAPEAAVLAAPNPVNEWGATRFSVLGMDARELRLHVHDLGGRLVYDSGWQLGPSYQWHLQDRRGRVVAGGVYLYWVEVRGDGGQTVRTNVERLLVLR